MKRIIFFLPLFFLLSGCYDAKEPNDIAYVVALGVDSAEDKSYEFTIQFAKTTQISGGASQEGGKEGSNIMELISVKAPSIYSGMNIANQVVSKRFTLAHTKLIVLSDEIAKNGVGDFFDSFSRNSDIRPHIYLAVSSGKAKEYLKAVKPVVEVNPVNYYRLIFESEYGGYVPRIILKDFYFQLAADDKQNILPLTGVNQENKKNSETSGEKQGSSQEDFQNSQESSNSQTSQPQQEEQKPSPQTNKQGFDFLTKDYVAGNLDVEKKNASEVIGMAIFKDNKMIGTANNIESVLYNMLRGTFKMSYISFSNFASADFPLTVSAEQQKSPYIRVKTDPDNPKIKIKIFLEGQLLSESSENPAETNIPECEKEIERATKEAIKNFLEKTKTEFNSDIVGFGQWAKINFLTYDDFEKYDWNSRYSQAEFDVQVNFDLRRIGFTDLRNEEEIREKVR